MKGSSRRSLIGLAAVAAMGIAVPASATVINIDFTSTATETAYSGNDGVLGTGGSVWNSVIVGTEVSGLKDETGALFDVGVAWTGNAGNGNFQQASSSELMNSGVSAVSPSSHAIDRVFVHGSFVKSWSDLYDITVYGTNDLAFALITGTSEHGYSPTSGNSRYRPDSSWADGVQYSVDYAQFPVDAIAVDLSSGYGSGFGFNIFSGAITGIQVSGKFTEITQSVPEPASLALLSLGLFGMTLRKRQAK